MLDWLAQTPVVLVTALVVFAPGAVALYGIGVRGLALFATAPLFGVAATGVTALVFGQIGIGWSVWSWALAMIVLAGVAWVLGRLLGAVPPVREPAIRPWILPVALVVGILFGVWRLAGYITDPAGISQTNDAVFHMNAVRFILESADASSLHVSAVVGGSGFYPAAWHALVSLIVLATGTSIPIAANMLTLVIGALIWPAGIAWLTVRATGSTTIAAYAAVLSASLQTFPLLMFQWGVLFPNALSIALIPAAVALVLLLRAWPAATTAKSIVRGALLVMIAAAALALSQPAALLPWAALVVVWLTFLALRPSWRTSRWRRAGAVAGPWLALGAVWFVLARGTSGSHWPPFRGKLEVFLDVLLNGQVLIPFAYGVSALMIVGLVVAVRVARLRWIVAAWIGLSALYVLVAAIGNPLVRGVLLGPWYADPYRLAALAPIAVIPLAAIGADAIVRFLGRRTVEPGEGSVATLTGLAGTALLMVVLVLLRPVAMPAFLEGTFDRESRYLLVADSYLDPDERALLEELPDLVEPGSRVIGNPSTGTGFGYMLSGVDVYPRTWSQPTTDAWKVVAAELRDAAEQPEVCEALAVLGEPGYVLDFGLGEQGPGRFEVPGMTDFSGRDGFELVAAEGDASLWRITACAQ